ncbi:MAG: sugar phosphate isomerase/epimerase [Planctomycetota bacterium]|nr:sugar phosphate isomerase/epimerase [Planctomycetota bacterium]
MFRIGYNTNGLAHHRLRDALDLLAGLGYGGVALTPDVGELDLYDLKPDRVRALRDQLRERDLSVAVETGARFVLEPLRKHRPNLMDSSARGRERRIDFYRRSIDLAADLGAPLVSIWSGAAYEMPSGDAPDADRSAADPLWDRLARGVVSVLDHAQARGVRVAFEPEPGMFVERPAGFLELTRRLENRGGELGLTLDLGHLVVTGDVPVGSPIRALAHHLLHVHLDDARPGVHEHLQLGTGELDLAGALTALREIGYSGMAAVELSRDSHRAPEAARTALDRIQAALPCGTRTCG